MSYNVVTIQIVSGRKRLELPQPCLVHTLKDTKGVTTQIRGHLIHGERTNWMVRVRTILEHGEDTPFPPFDRYAMYEASKGQSMGDLLETFATLRTRYLDDLRALKLTPAQLEARGTHPDLGPVTLAQLLATWTVHDLGHTHQIAKAMAHQYRAEVGPWRKYLTILPQG